MSMIFTEVGSNASTYYNGPDENTVTWYVQSLSNTEARFWADFRGERIDLTIRGQFSGTASADTILTLDDLQIPDTDLIQSFTLENYFDITWSPASPYGVAKNYLNDVSNDDYASVLSGNDIYRSSSIADENSLTYLWGGNDLYIHSRPVVEYADIFYGGDGVDTVQINQTSDNFSLVRDVYIWDAISDGERELRGDSLTHLRGTLNTVDLHEVERIQFTDVNVGLDTDITGSSGQTALLIGAVLPGQLAFDESKRELLGNVIELFDAGFTMDQLSGALMRLPIWDTLTGKANYTNTDIANYLWTNVHGVAPTSAELSAGVQALNSQTGEQQGLWLSQLAQSQANQLHINLVGIQETGLIYL